MSAPATIPALRGAILSGRRVLVVTAGRLEPYAREAAVVAGREGELRVLHVGTAPHAPFRVRPDSRANPTANVVYGTDLMADLADVPVADATDLAAAGILVVLHAEGGRVEDAHVCEAMRAFARRGPDRAVFCVEPPDLVGAPVPVGAWPGGRTFPLDALAAMPGLAPATGATAHALGWSRTAWDAALENCMAGTESGEDIGRERAAWVASPDRLALVVREAGALAAYEVGPDGWCEVGAVLQPDLGDMSAAVVARAVWRGGLARASIRLDWHGGPRAGAPNPVHRLLVFREAGTPARDAIDAALARMDVQLLTALGSGPGAHALFRTVVAGAGPARETSP